MPVGSITIIPRMNLTDMLWILVMILNALLMFSFLQRQRFSLWLSSTLEGPDDEVADQVIFKKRRG